MVLLRAVKLMKLVRPIVEPGSPGSGDNLAPARRPRRAPRTGVDKQGQVRVKRPDKWAKNVAKKKLNLGQSYVSYVTKR